MKLTSLYFWVATLIVAVHCKPSERSSYDGFKLFRIIPQNHQHFSWLESLKRSYDHLDFWSSPSELQKPVDVMVPPEEIDNLVKMLETFQMEHSVIIDDVQQKIDSQQREVEQESENEGPSFRDQRATLSFTKFSRVSEIYSYLDALAATHSGIAKTFVIGKSGEGRDLKGIKIGKPSSGKKPAIWIDGGVHAREWIAPATVLYIIDQLTNHYTANKDLVDSVDWYILPIVNPDGYEYTHHSNRLWRKTRSSSTSGCRGTDGNRNFGFHWNQGGSSGDPCSDIYRGRSAFSEPETKAISDYIMPKKSDFKVFLTFHSYGQMWLTPWGYTSQLPNDYNDLVALAKKATAALAVPYGTRYTIGSSTNVLYVASGGADDWAKGTAGIKYSYTVELRDRGSHGFLLPASQIQATGYETFLAMKVIGEAAKTM